MDIKALKEEIAKGMRSFKAFEDAHNTLASLESLEQAEKDLTAKVKTLTNDVSDLAKQKIDLTGAVDAAKKLAGEIVTDAKEIAKRIVDDGQKAADDAAKKTVKAASDNLAQITQDIANGKQTLAGINKGIEGAGKELSVLTSNLAAAKEQAKRLLGG